MTTSAGPGEPGGVVAEMERPSKTALTLELPCGVNGRLVEPSESHFYSFQATKDQYYLFEIEANRFGLPLDAVVQVYDAAGKKLVEADDLNEAVRVASKHPAALLGEQRVAEAERQAIERALAASGGNKTQAARILGITPKTLNAKLSLYNKE